MKLSDKKQ